MLAIQNLDKLTQLKVLREALALVGPPAIPVKPTAKIQLPPANFPPMRLRGK
jgi:hypothetical protein